MTSPSKPIPESADTYGADRNGMVWSYAFEPARPAVALGPEALGERLSPASDNGFLWLHFLTSPQAERWMRSHLDLPETFFEALDAEPGSMRLERQDMSLVAVMHDVLFAFNFDPADVSTVVLCIAPRLLVSARLKPLRSVDRLRAAVRAGNPFRSTTEILSHLLRDQAGVLADIVRRSNARVDAIEDQLLGEKLPPTGGRWDR